MSGLLQDCCNQRPSKTWLKLKTPASEAVRPGARGAVALASAHPSLHGSAQMENATKASTATLRTIIAIAVTSMMESRFAMHQFLRQSRDARPNVSGSSL